jgi:hypothetical protein
MNATKVRFFGVAVLCLAVSGCGEIMQKGFGVNRCDRPSDVGSTGWVKGRQGCYDAKCVEFRNGDEVTGYGWRRTGPYESCD